MERVWGTTASARMGDVSSGLEEQEARLVTVTEPSVGDRTRADAEDPHGDASSRLGTGQLLDILRAVAAVPERWRPLVRHQIDRRNYEHLVLAEDHEVVLICWDVGQMTLLHDHHTSVGAFVVVEGSLLEDYGRAGSSSLRQRRVSRGQARSFGPSYVHNLVNPGPGVATSIHAYSPAITRLNYYAVLPGGVVRVRSLSVDNPEPPAP
jgi:predicted metal-dependent enzyme (double-stranded beta helix superfamily)